MMNRFNWFVAITVIAVIAGTFVNKIFGIEFPSKFAELVYIVFYMSVGFALANKVIKKEQ